VAKKLIGLIPDFTVTPLDVGLTKTIDWFWKEREKLLGTNRPGFRLRC
jgi:GDP-L-fucose synthase